MIVMVKRCQLETIKKIFPAIPHKQQLPLVLIWSQLLGLYNKRMNVWGDSIGSLPEQAAAVLTQTAKAVSNASVSMEQNMWQVPLSFDGCGYERRIHCDQSDYQHVCSTNIARLKPRYAEDGSHLQKQANWWINLVLSYTDAAGNMKPVQADSDWSKRQDQRYVCLKAAAQKTLFDTSGMQTISP